MMYRFQNYCDVATRPEKMTMITVYAGGSEVIKRTLPFFMAFKHYKLGPVTVKMIPSSTLPVDPTGLSYGAGDNTVDPRDQLSPGLVRITNGEDFYTQLSALEADTSHAVYNAMMLDPRWFKFSLQRGIRKTAYPYYWQIGQIRQDYYPGATINVPQMTVASTAEQTLPNKLVSTGTIQIFNGVPETAQSGTAASTAMWGATDHSSGRGIFQTGQHGRMGWMPTDAQIFIGVSGQHHTLGNLTPKVDHVPAMAAVPQVELIRIILPPAWKTKFYYRVFITETVYFKDPVIQNPEYWFNRNNQWAHMDVAPLDRFIRIHDVNAEKPITDKSYTLPTLPKTRNDGANDARTNLGLTPDPVIPPIPKPTENNNDNDNTAGQS